MRCLRCRLETSSDSRFVLSADRESTFRRPDVFRTLSHAAKPALSIHPVADFFEMATGRRPSWRVPQAVRNEIWP